MLLDWFTVFAQIVNFLILVLLLRIFLYDKIVKAVKQREQAIADRFEEARNQRLKAEQDAKELAAQKEQLANKADEFLKQARQEAAALKEELVMQARQEADQQKNAWLKAIEQDREAFLRELSRLVAGQVVEVAQKILADLADQELEARVAQAFVNKIENLSPDEAASLRQAFANAGQPPLVQSSLPMSDAAQQKIAKTIKNTLGLEKPPHFETDKQLVLGISLYCNGKRLALSAQDYLDALLEKTGQMIVGHTGQQPGGQPQEKEE